MAALWATILFQPAETAGYLALGMAVIFGLMAAYGWRLRSLRRSLERELEDLDRVDRAGSDG